MIPSGDSLTSRASPPMTYSSANHQVTTPVSVYEDTSIRLDLNWKQLVRAEIIAVTSAMRKNARWANMKVSRLHMGGLGTDMGLRRSHSKPGTVSTPTNPPSLMDQFMSLREYLDQVEDTRQLDAKRLLEPFLEVVLSGNTTGPILEIVLSSIEKFLQYGIVGLHNENIAIAMNTLSSAATHCKYEPSNQSEDEFVLLKILQVLQTALTSSCGQVLSDESVCKMMETGLTVCCQMRLSEMLKRSAKHVVTKMIMAIFERIRSLEEEWQLVNFHSDTEDAQYKAEIHMPALPLTSSPASTSETKIDRTTKPGTDAVQTDTVQSDTPHLDTDQSDHPAANVEAAGPLTGDSTKKEDKEGDIKEAEGARPLVILENEDNEEITMSGPYGLPAAEELIRVLISLLNPEEPLHTESMRLTALDFLTVAFEIGGKSISRFEVLRKRVADDLCRHLFQLAKTDSLPLLSLSLRTITTVFGTFRPYLKLQQELFLFFLIERLMPYADTTHHDKAFDIDEHGNLGLVATTKDDSSSPGAGATENQSASPTILTKTSDRSNKGYSDPLMIGRGELQEMLLESLLQCAGDPAFMVDLWFNYDSDLSCGDLLEAMIQFISKNSFPARQNFNVLCMDTLLAFIEHLVVRLDSKDTINGDYVELPSAEELLKRKTRKRIILKGAYLFNENPKKGIQFLRDEGIVVVDEHNDDKTSLSRFLMSAQQLNKKSLGEYLGKPENVGLLGVFMHQFDFRGKRMVEALRNILETFRLPGESQQIERITEKFAEAFYEAHEKDGSKEINNVDAALVLTFSIIMLNTDQHNPQIKRRMTLEDFTKNLRGVNDNTNFSHDYLREIYEEIRKDEIVMPEEHEGRLGFNYAWKQLLHRSESAGMIDVCDKCSYDKVIFEQMWKPAVGAIALAFEAAEDDSTMEKAITGFQHCARLASEYELYDVLDCIVISLTTMTGLIEKNEKFSSFPDPVVEVEGQKYVVSSLAVEFGRSYKAQLAAVVMFTIVKRHGKSLRKGWTKVLQSIRNLFINSLLPSSMLEVEDFLSGTTSIPLKPKKPAASKQQERRDGSLLSTLSAYLLSPYSNDQVYRTDPTEEEVESTMCAVDCIGACKLDELFANISSLDTDSLTSLMAAISSVGYDTKVGQETAEPTPYDPVAVLFLEFMVSMAVRNSDRIEILWPHATGYMFGILENAEKESILVVERTVAGLLRLCISVSLKPNMYDEILKSLCLLRDFPPTVMQAVAEQMMAGIYKLSSEMRLSANESLEGQSTTELVNAILEIKQKVGSSL